MKKLLALVLALVMTLSLCVTSNAAYKDAADVDYKEAVDVMTAIGVFNGDENGKFNPDGILTREQGAKIITYMLLGKTAADALATPSAPFADVAADRWSAGSIAYAVSQGILAGVGNGKFDPTGALTNAAFAKMLLVALGYDAEIEGLVGGDWALKTASLVNKIDLADGLGGVSYNAAITRDQAAKFGYNTLTATLVQYDRSRSVGTNGSSINTDLQASYVGNGAEAAGAGYKNGTTPYTQFCEVHFSKLKLNTNGKDNFGRTADVWTLSGVKIGTYEKSASITYTKSMRSEANQKVIKADLENYNNFDQAVDVTTAGGYSNFVKQYINGYEVENGTSGSSAATDVASIAKLTGDGRTVEIFTKDNEITNIVVTDKLLAKVKSVDTKNERVTYTVYKTAATGTVAGNVAVVTANVDFTTDKGYGDVKKDDFVLLTFTDTANSVLTAAAAETIRTVEAATVVTGIASSRTSTSITLAGTKYDAAANVYDAGTDHDVANFGVSNKYDATLYTDADGYVYYTKAGAAATKDYAIGVTKSYVALNKDNQLVPMIEGVTSDGQTVNWEVETETGAVNGPVNTTNYITITKNAVYTYADADSDNKYEITLVNSDGDITNANATAAATVRVAIWTDSTTKSLNSANASSNTAEAGAAVTTGVTNTAYLDGNTKFIYLNNNKATVLTSVPKIGTSAAINVAYVALRESSGTNYVSAVYISAAAPASATSTGEIVFVGAPTGTTQVTDKSTGNSVTFCNYSAWVDGVKVDDFYAAANAEPGFYYAKTDDDTGAYLLSGNEYTATTGKTAAAEALTIRSQSYAGMTLTTGGKDYDLTDATIIDLVTNTDGTGNNFKSAEDMVGAAATSYLYTIYDADTMKASYAYVVGGLYTMSTVSETDQTDAPTTDGNLIITLTPSATYAFVGQTVTYTLELSGTSDNSGGTDHGAGDTITVAGLTNLTGATALTVNGTPANAAAAGLTVTITAANAATSGKWTVSGTVTANNITATATYAIVG